MANESGISVAGSAAVGVAVGALGGALFGALGALMSGGKRVTRAIVVSGASGAALAGVAAGGLAQMEHTRLESLFAEDGTTSAIGRRRHRAPPLLLR